MEQTGRLGSFVKQEKYYLAGITIEQQDKIKTQSDAVKLMMEHTSIIKRPVIETGNNLLVGFKEEEYTAAFK